MKLSKQKARRRLALEAGAAVLVALGLDILGEPPAAWHPVVWYGKLIQRLELATPGGRIPQLLYGVVMLALAAPAAFLPAAIVQRLAKRVRVEARQHGCPSSGFILYALMEGIGLKPFFALRMLADAGRSVRLALEQGNLPAAQHALQSLVSRERSELTAELAGAAAIESLAENLSDSIIAPLLYYTLFGLRGAAAYRLFNTFDSMVGYHGRYEYLGRASDGRYCRSFRRATGEGRPLQARRQRQGHHCLEYPPGRADGVEHRVRRRLPHSTMQNALEAPV